MFTHPSIDDYDNWANVWTAPRPADAAQYIKNFSGVFSQASPRLNFWRAYSGPDNVVRYVRYSSSCSLGLSKLTAYIASRNCPSWCRIRHNILPLQCQPTHDYHRLLVCLQSTFCLEEMLMTHRSTGITSRGRIGINAALAAQPIVNPWFVDPVDKAVLIQGLNDILSTVPSGA